MVNRLSKIPYLIQQDNFFTEKECKSLIRKYKKLCTSDSLKTYLNYNYHDIKMTDDWGKKLLEIVNKYIKKYKGLDIIEQWAIDILDLNIFLKIILLINGIVSKQLIIHIEFLVF